MIERLYVHNYRCLENFTLDLNGQRSILLIGRNGAGKSTVLHALQVFQRICRGPNRVKSVISAGDFTRGRTGVPMRFEADTVVAGKRCKYSVSFEWPEQFHEARVLEEALVSDGVEIFTRSGREVKLSGGIKFGLDWHVFALPVINERPPAHTLQDVKAFFAGLVILCPIPQQMLGFSEEPSTELHVHGTNFASCLRAMLQQKPKAYSALTRHLQSVIPDFSSLENRDRGKNGGSQLVVAFEQPDSADSLLTLDFDALSDGEKCLLLSAYLVAVSAAGSPVVCVWDEPDSHLSLAEVGQFIIALRKLASADGQFIGTSHNPEVVRRFSDENTFVLTRKSHLDPVVVQPLSAHHYTGDLINALMRGEIIG